MSWLQHMCVAHCQWQPILKSFHWLLPSHPSPCPFMTLPHPCFWTLSQLGPWPSGWSFMTPVPGTQFPHSCAPCKALFHSKAGQFWLCLAESNNTTPEWQYSYLGHFLWHNLFTMPGSRPKGFQKRRRSFFKPGNSAGCSGAGARDQQQQPVVEEDQGPVVKEDPLGDLDLHLEDAGGKGRTLSTWPYLITMSSLYLAIPWPHLTILA